MDRRPPLAVSPRRLRPRQSHAAAARPPLASSVHITSPGFSKKAHAPMRSSICALPPSSYSYSYLETSPGPKLDFTVGPTPTRAAGKENLLFPDDDEEPFKLADTGKDDWTANVAPPTSPLFERGRFYDLYSARRNERLKRKHGWYAAGEEEAGAMAEDPCVAVELSKRRGAKKAGPVSAVRRSMPAPEFSQSYRASRGLSSTMRSSLRSSKEMKKPSAASSSCAGATAAKPSAVKDRRLFGSRSSSVRRI